MFLGCGGNVGKGAGASRHTVRFHYIPSGGKIKHSMADAYLRLGSVEPVGRSSGLIPCPPRPDGILVRPGDLSFK